MGKITDIDIKDKLYSLLKSKGVDLEITGRIYKDKRPANSQLEDIQITILDSDADQVQVFIVNVNAFVPDVRRGDEWIENEPRLRELSAILLRALESYVADGYRIVLSKQMTMKLNDVALHVINNRVTVQYCTE